MIVFPNCKINIGLSITGKRPDGYHNIESVMVPIGWHEALEVVERDAKSNFDSVAVLKAESGNARFFGYGTIIPGPPESNLCLKVFELLESWYNLPKTDIHLIKSLPIGAGLGGGSADAAFCLRALVDFYQLTISDSEAKSLLSEVGSDCPFFWKNKAAFVFGTGTTERNIDIDLGGYWICVIYPNIKVGTAEAYAGIKPKPPEVNLALLGDLPIETWKECIHNDFEPSIFNKYPALKNIKQTLYNHGAIYASLSGSGSAIYGIFDQKPNEIPEFREFRSWIGEMRD
ncbi:MAG: 4-(cytidine 5'-diphospho)-2-C-methyl-D-erythritol kinase [Salibacteraceae bacterium]